jgi:hypothetical protein
VPDPFSDSGEESGHLGRDGRHRPRTR